MSYQNAGIVDKDLLEYDYSLEKQTSSHIDVVIPNINHEKDSHSNIISNAS